MKKTRARLDKRAILAVLACAAFALGAPLGGAAAEVRDGDDKDKDFLLGGVVVTATRTEVEAFKANANVSVITAKDIENNHWRDLSDALRSVPGVYVGNYGQTGYQSNNSLYINGSNNVVVLIDGVKVNMSESPKFSPTMFTNLDNIERIEVLKGSSSTLYGSDAKGGVINIITKKIDGVKTTFKFGAGSFGAENYSFANEGREAGWAWRVQYKKDFAGDFKDGNGVTWESYLNAATTSLSLKREFGENSDLTLTYDSYKTGSNSYYDYIYGGGVSNFDINNHNTKVIYNIRFNDQTTNQLSYLNNMYDTIGNDSRSSWATKIETHRISDQFTRIINDNHTLTTGFEYTQDIVKSMDERKLTNKSFYIQDEWNLTNQWKLTGGLRYDNNSGFGNHTSPSVNLGYEFNPDTNMYIGYSQYFIAPTASQLYADNEIGNPNLKPESGNTSEIGINHRIDETFVVSAHLFKRNSKDRIDWVDDYSKPWWGYYDNVGDQKANGWDIQLRKRFGKSTNAYVGYTHTHVDAVGSGANNVNGYLPRGAWNLGVDYTNDKLGISLAGRGVIDKPGPQAATVAFPASTYWVWDIGVNYQTSLYAKIFVKINNIFNKYYAEQTAVSSKGSGQWYAMPGRNIYAGMQYSF